MLLGHFPEISSMDDGSLGVSRVDLVDGHPSADGDVLHGLASLRDDADRLRDGFGSNWVVS